MRTICLFLFGFSLLITAGWSCRSSQESADAPSGQSTAELMEATRIDAVALEAEIIDLQLVVVPAHIERGRVLDAAMGDIAQLKEEQRVTKEQLAIVAQERAKKEGQLKSIEHEFNVVTTNYAQAKETLEKSVALLRQRDEENAALKAQIKAQDK